MLFDVAQVAEEEGQT